MTDTGPTFSTPGDQTSYPDLSAFEMSQADIEARRGFIGGSDAKIISDGSEEAVLNLWLDKTGQAKAKKSAKSLAMYMGSATEALNAAWYVSQTGDPVTSPQLIATRIYDGLPMRATLDGLCKNGTAIWEAKHVSGYDFQKKEARNIETVAAEYFAQLQHNMFVAGKELSVLSVLFDNNRHEHMVIEADPFYLDALCCSEDDFWQHVLNNTPPSPIKLPPGKIVATKTVDMAGSADWQQAANEWLAHRDAAKAFDKAAADIKSLIESDVLRAEGHGIVANRDKRGSIRISAL